MSGNNIDWIRGICVAVEHQSAVWQNKIYTIGGTTFPKFPPRFNLPSPSILQASDAQLRILDFTKSVDFSKIQVESIKRLPDTVPVVKHFQWFAGGGKLRLFGGQPCYWWALNDDGTATKGHREDLGNRMWTYDITDDKWVMGTSGQGEEVSTYTQQAYDPESGQAWVFGGKYELFGYYIAGNMTTGQPLSNATWVQKAPVANGQNFIKKTLTKWQQFDIGEGTFKDVTKPNFAPEEFFDMKMVHVPAKGKDGKGKGVTILLGGNGARAFREAHVFDVTSQSWFLQELTAEENDFPMMRKEYCVAVGSAPDGSSHNVYMYGGWTTNQKSGTEEVKNLVGDVYILSLPAFHWVYGGRSTEPRYMHTCVKLQEKYMVVHRGSMDLASHAAKCYNADTLGLQMLDMSTLEWTTKYEVQDKPRYGVPLRVSAVIGGNANGGANFRVPRRGFASEKMAALFDIPPSTGNDTSTQPSNSPGPTSSDVEIKPQPSGNDSGLTNTELGGAIAGAIVGCIVLLWALVMLYKRYKRKQRIRAMELDARPPPPQELDPGTGSPGPQMGMMAYHQQHGQYYAPYYGSPGSGITELQSPAPGENGGVMYPVELAAAKLPPDQVQEMHGSDVDGAKWGQTNTGDMGREDFTPLSPDHDHLHNA